MPTRWFRGGLLNYELRVTSYELLLFYELLFILRVTSCELLLFYELLFISRVTFILRVTFSSYELHKITGDIDTKKILNSTEHIIKLLENIKLNRT